MLCLWITPGNDISGLHQIIIFLVYIVDIIFMVYIGISYLWFILGYRIYGLYWDIVFVVYIRISYV